MSAALDSLRPQERASALPARRDDSEQIAEVFDRMRSVEDRVTRSEEKYTKHDEICAIRYKGINDSLEQIQYYGIRVAALLVGIQLLGGHGFVRVIAEKLGVHLP